MRLARRVAEIEPFHVMALLARARELEAQGRSIIHMEIGEPDFPTPEPIVRAGMRALEKGEVFYTPTPGLPQLRAAIADYYRTRYGVRLAPTRILVTTGASAALMLAAFAVPATLIFHNFWSVDAAQYTNQVNHFMKNLSILGALVFIMGAGAGPFSLGKESTSERQ